MTTLAMEVRDAAVAWPDHDFDIRAVGDGLEFRGYAAVFNSPSADLGGFTETIAPGAFSRAVNAAANGSADVRMFWNHNQDIPLASTKAKTLRLSQDDNGLLAEATLSASTHGRDMSTLIREGNVRSMSFGFTVRGKGGEAWSGDHKQRTLTDLNLHEVSPVTGWPAYAATSTSVRHLLSMVDWDEDDSIAALVGDLSETQRSAFFRHLNAANPTPYIAPAVAEALARLRKREAA